MKEELLAFLQSYKTTSIEAKDWTLPIYSGEKPAPLSIIPDENIAEIIEETLDDYDSLTDYVEEQLEHVEQSTALDTFRTLVSQQLIDTELAEESAKVSTMDHSTLYATYSRLWEDQPLLDEQMIASKVDSLAPDQAWISRQEEEWIQLSLPIGQEYTAPLIIPMGGFNECPAPAIQASLFKYWQEKYDAVPIIVNESTWILQAKIQPSTDAEALQLAQEHFIFCSYVLEKFDSIGAYAAYLQTQDIWYFWWD